MGAFSRYSEFVDFARGPQHWRYTSDDRPLVWASQTFDNAPFKRGRISESFDVSRTTLDIDVPLTLPLLDLYRGTSPMGDLNIILYRRRKSTGVVQIRWMGVIGSVEFKPSIATIHGLPPGAALSANGLNRCWQAQCDRVVYGVGLGECNKDPQAMRVDGTIRAVSGSVIESDALASKPDGWFSGGWVEWTEGTNVERRFVFDHVGGTATLLTPARVPVGTAVTFYPGCDHTAESCDTKFNNMPNYGGQLFIPKKNPFGNDPVY
ncbi:MAG: DUF2163 domain-containing protein [Luteibacter sp.]